MQDTQTNLHFKLRTKQLVATLLVLLSLVSCSKELPKTNIVRVGYMPIAECLPFFVALENGYFNDEGLKIEPLQFPGGSAILEALGSKSVDIGFSNVVSLLYAVNSGLDFKSVWGSNMENIKNPMHALVTKNSAISSPIDLKNKSIAVNTLRNIDHLLIENYLSKYNVKSNEIKLLEIPFPRMPSILNSGDVDAIAVVEPFLSIVVGDGGKVIGKYFSMGKDETLITTYCSSGKWIKDNNKNLHKFIQAMDKAIDYYLNNPVKSKRILAKYTKLTEDRIETISYPTYKKELPSLDDLKAYVQLMNKMGWIQKETNIGGLLYD